MLKFLAKKRGSSFKPLSQRWFCDDIKIREGFMYDSATLKPMSNEDLMHRNIAETWSEKHVPKRLKQKCNHKFPHFSVIGFNRHPLMPLYIENLRPYAKTFDNFPKSFVFQPKDNTLFYEDKFDFPKLNEGDFSYFFPKADIQVLSTLNGDECIEHLQKTELDVAILMSPGAPLLDARVFEIPKYGIISVHPALLPEVPSMCPYAWSILNDIPLGCTVQLLKNNVNQGDIILRQEFRPMEGSTYNQAIASLEKLSVELLVKALRQLQKDNKFRIRPAKAKYEILPFKTKNQSIKAEAKARKKFESGLYPHFRAAKKI